MLTWLLGRRLQGKLFMLPSFAAAMAFYFLVSLVPFLLVVSRCVSIVFSANLTPELLSFLHDILPPESAFSLDAISESLGKGSSGLAAASTVLALWTASSGLNEMARAVNFLFSESEREQSGWGLRGKSFVVLGIWALATAVMAIAFVILPIIHAELTRLGAGRLLPPAFASIYRYPTAFAMLFAAFASTYVFVPRKSPSWSAAAQGAAVAAASWSAVSLLFAYLMPRVWHVSVFNGALSSALALLVWAYCGAWGALLGALVAVRVDEK